MENPTIKKEVSYLQSIGKWCCGIYSYEPFSIWTGGFFHKNREKAIKLAEDAFRKSFLFYDDIRKTKESMESREEVFTI